MNFRVKRLKKLQLYYFMKKRNVLFFAFMLMTAWCVNAQTQNPLTAENQLPNDERALTVFDGFVQVQADPSITAVRTTWIASRPKDNWFFSLYGGAALLQSEESRYRDFADQLHPTVGLAIGRWFSPVWGLRVSTSAAKLQGFVIDGTYGTGNPHYFMGGWHTGKYYASSGSGALRHGVQSSYTDCADNALGNELVAARFLNLDNPITVKEGTGYSYDITYAAASLDFMVNLKNMVFPYNHQAFFNPVMYAGIGYAHTFAADDTNPEAVQDLLARNGNFKENKTGQTAVNSVMGKFGMQLNFRLGSRWDFFLDGQGLIVPEYFDRRMGDNLMHDFIFNATAGFTYHLKFRHFLKTPVMDPAEIDALNRQINELRNRPQVCPPVVVCPPAEQVVVEQRREIMLTPVFFTLDSYVVRDNQLISIARAAQYLIDNPKSKIQIAAYADRNTGNPAHNMKLSQNRANAVANVLVDKFGIDRDRLNVTFFGDKVQPFDQNDWNRVAIFIVP